MADLRILVSGSRTWRQPATIGHALETASATSNGRRITVVHGGASGADRMAGHYAKQRGWNVEVHPANWADCGDDCPPPGAHRRVGRRGEYCPTAGHRRNQAMVDASIDMVVAFWRDHSAGAGDCLRRAEQAGLPIQRYLDCACHPVGQPVLFT